MDAVVQALTDQLVWAIGAVFKFIAVGIVTVPATWGIVEWVFPPNSSAQINKGSALAMNVLAFVGLQYAGTVQFGVGLKGYVAAFMFACLAGGLTPLFHTRFIKAFAPGITNPNV